MKLIAFELKKLLGMRFLRIALAVLLTVCFILSFYAAENSQRNTIPYRELDEFYRLYFKNQAEMDAYYKELTQSSVQDPMQHPGSQQAAQRYAPEGYTDLQMFSALYASIEQAQKHPERMDAVVIAAEKNLAEFRAMGISEDSYNYRLQEKIIDKYSELKDTVRIGIEPSRGWDIYFNYSTQNALLFLMLLLLSVSVASCDRVADMLPVIHCTKRGKKGTVRAKMLAVVTASFCLPLIFSLASFLAVGLACGYSSVANAIQSVTGFAYCQCALSIGQYFALSLLLRALGFCLFGALVALIATLIRNRALAFGAGLLLLVSQYALNCISYINPDSPLKNLNLVAITNSTPLFARLRACNLFGAICTYAPLALCTCAALTVIALVLFGVIYVNGQTGVAKSRAPFKLPVIFQNRKSKRHLPRFHPNRLIKAELYKMLIASGMVAVLLLIGACKVAYAQYRYQNPHTVSDGVYYGYMIELQGPLTEQTLLRIQTQREEIDTILAAEAQMQQDFIDGKVTASDYAEYLKKFEYARSKDTHLAVIEQKRDRLLSIKQSSGDGWLLYDTGWLNLLRSGTDLLLILAIALFSCHAFSMEHRSNCPSDGFIAILRSTPKGRTKTYFAKMTVVLSVSTLLCVAFSIADVLTVASQYALPAADAPLASLAGFETFSSTVSIGGFCALALLEKCAFSLLLSLAVFSLSCLLRRSLYALAVGTVGIALPAILVQTQLAGAAALVTILALLLCAVLVIASYRKFTK